MNLLKTVVPALLVVAMGGFSPAQANTETTFGSGRYI